MRSNRPLAGILALVTVILAVVGELLVLRHIGDWLGLALLGVAVCTAVASWIALGRPVKRSQVGAARDDR
jgi:hypothetical protein